VPPPPTCTYPAGDGGACGSAQHELRLLEPRKDAELMLRAPRVNMTKGVFVGGGKFPLRPYGPPPPQAGEDRDFTPARPWANP
jgi:hypothetical protein